MAFSITEKLAVTGAFLAMVAMVVGTEDDPGVVAVGQEAVEAMPAREAPVQSQPEASDEESSAIADWWYDDAGARAAAEADRRGSAGVDPAPEP